jgi:hypothetical protein
MASFASLNGGRAGGTVGTLFVANAGAADLRTALGARRPVRNAALALLASVLLHVAGLAGGLALIGTSYLDIDPELQIPNVLTPSAVAGVMVWFLLGLTAGPISAAFALLLLRPARESVSALYPALAGLASGLTALLSVGITSGLAGLAWWSWSSLILADQTFNTAHNMDVLKQFLGGLLFTVYAPLAAAAAYVTVAYTLSPAGGWKRAMGLGPSAGSDDNDENDSDQGGSAATLLGGKARKSTKAAKAAAASLARRPHQPDGFLSNFPGVLFGLLVLTSVAGSTAILSCVWAYSSFSYFASLGIDNDVVYTIVQGVQWVLGPVPDPSSTYVQAVINIKLYVDVVVYFSVLGGIMLLGFLGLRSPAVRRALHARLAARFSLAWRKSMSSHAGTNGLYAWLVAVTVGETVVVAAVLGLFAFWLWFWSTGYPRILQEAQAANDTYITLHVWARTLGHMTTLAMSFVTFPVTRNSVWTSAFGIPFERAIKHHRALGRLVWLLVTVHMLLWQAKWALEGTLWANVVTIRALEVTLCESSGSPCVVTTTDPSTNVTTVTINGSAHVDNFTVVLAETAWFMLTVVLIIAQFCRRKNYELFHYTHHLVFVFFLVALIHGERREGG